MLYLLQCTEEAWCCFFCAVTIVDNALVCQCTRLAIIGHVSVHEHSCGLLQCLTTGLRVHCHSACLCCAYPPKQAFNQAATHSTHLAQCICPVWFSPIPLPQCLSRFYPAAPTLTLSWHVLSCHCDSTSSVSGGVGCCCKCSSNGTWFGRVAMFSVRP